MPRARTIVVLLIAFAVPASALGASSAGSTTTGERAATRAAATVTRAASLEELVLQEINTVRARRGLGGLAASPALSRSAAAHSRAMATYGFFSHESRNGATFSARIKRFYAPGSRAWTVGENLAMFGGATPSAAAIVDAWMGSPGHRANLLRGLFHEAGVAIMFNPAAGGVFGGESTWVVTLDLGSR
ncbi:MAG TPA: CAP domain-containing protein [Gaiella sp.]|jgi:uncharacterized protein YkwD|nr:CAP domain-containing protein [Gaiella sp.]